MFFFFFLSPGELNQTELNWLIYFVQFHAEGLLAIFICIWEWHLLCLLASLYLCIQCN